METRNLLGDLGSVIAGNKPLQVSVGIDAESALVLGIAILLAVTMGVFIGTKAAKL
jgi:hypothetical protein